MFTLPAWAMYTLFGIQLMDLVVSKIQKAEETFKAPGQGAAKKDMVKKEIQSGLALAEAMSSGGQKQTLGAVSTIVNALDGPIDNMVSILYPKN